MGVFDTRCALSGLVLRSGKVLVIPLIAPESATEGFPAGLPIAGELDGYGTLDPIAKSPAFEVFAKGVLARATFEGKAPKGAKKLLDHLTALDEAPVALDGRHLGIAYVLSSIYDALVAVGSRNQETSLRLRGKKDAASLFEVAFTEAELARQLYAERTSDAQEKDIRLALTAFVRTGLGRRTLPLATEQDREQYDGAAIAAALAEARARFKGVSELEQALDAYAKAMLDDDDDDDDDDGDDDDSDDGVERHPVAPVLQARLPDIVSGFRGSGARFERDDGDVHLVLEMTLRDGRRARFVACPSVSAMSTDPEGSATSMLTALNERLPTIVVERRVLMGDIEDLETIAGLFKTSWQFITRFVESTDVAPAHFVELVRRMRKMPYTDEIRLAWIKLLGRPDCPIEVADLLADHTSKSVLEAVAARRARG